MRRRRRDFPPRGGVAGTIGTVRSGRMEIRGKNLTRRAEIYDMNQYAGECAHLDLWRDALGRRLATRRRPLRGGFCGTPAAARPSEGQPPQGPSPFIAPRARRGQGYCTMMSARFGSWRWLALAALVCVLFAAPARSLAQPDAPDAPAAAPAAPADGKADSKAAGGGLIDFMVHFFESLGIIGIVVLGAISICLVAFIVLLFLDLRPGAVIPAGFVDEFTDTVNKRQFKQAFDLARNDNSFMARVLTAGMSRLQYGLEDAREASRNMLDTIKSGKDQLNSYLSVIGTVGPLLGLVGTVYGMIKAFMALNAPGASIDPKVLADGISHALCMTLAGVGLALPAIFFNAFFKNRIMHVSMDCGNIADDLLTQMYHNSKKPAPPAGAVPAVAAVPNGPTDSRGVAPAKPA